MIDAVLVGRCAHLCTGWPAMRRIGGGVAAGILIVAVWFIGSASSAPLRIMSMLVGAEYVDQVGVVRQQNAFDCGVAAMEMVVVELTGDRTAFDSARTAARIGRRGLSFRDMRDLATARGVHAVGRRMRMSDLHVTLAPVVLQFRDHFVLFDGFDASGAAILRDPAIGRVRMNEGALRRSWTGMVLVFPLRRS